MLNFYVAPEHLSSLKALVNAEFRLHEVVQLYDLSALQQSESDACHLITHQTIKLALDWHNQQPPFLLPYPLPLSPAHFLAVAYTLLGNFEMAYQHAEQSPALLHDIDALNRIQHGIQVNLPPEPTEFSNPLEEYRYWHNAAVIAHYAETTHFVHYSLIRRYYERAFDLAPNDEFRAFTGKHWATLLLDADELNAADQLLSACIGFAISETATIELRNLQSGVWMKQLHVPYDPVLLENIKTTLWQVLQYYENHEQPIQAALLLVDASQVANYTDSFAESLGYINRAIQLLEQEEMPELVANAQYRKATLLFTWAQQGHSQFFRPAMDAYHQALKVFTKDQTPDIFAEIQHHLGVIYSEIPDEVKKKSVWAAISVSSFKEAFGYFTRETNPYEYARLCNSYANALTKYPEAKLTDNYAKALDFYREALQIRTADEYPYERTLTLLNFLESAWLMSLTDETQQQALFEEMTLNAEEILTLVEDPKLCKEAEEHLQRLAVLKEKLSIA
ncbi:MAG: hypothetical protein U0Y10_22720 [Spirosomataceae bacterium]